MVAPRKAKTWDDVTWKPNGRSICDVLEKVTLSGFNTWCGLIKPRWHDHFIRGAKLGEHWLQPWREHLAYLVPIENERNRFEQWVAHILQRPGDFPQTGWYFIATNTGIGRNWLGNVLSHVIFGYVLNNAVLDSILDGNYNGRISRKLLMVVDEARAGMRGSNTWALSEN